MKSDSPNKLNFVSLVLSAVHYLQPLKHKELATAQTNGILWVFR